MQFQIHYIIFSQNKHTLQTHLEYISKIKHHLSKVSIITPNHSLDTSEKFDYYIFANDHIIGLIPFFDTYLTILYHIHVPNHDAFLCSPHNRTCGIVNYDTLLKHKHDLLSMYSQSRYVYSFPDPLLAPLQPTINHKLTLGFLNESVASQRMRYFAQVSSLTYLDLSDQHLNDTLIPMALHKHILSLNLSNNLISDASISTFLQFPIEVLNLDNNHISNDGVILLTKHTTLKTLFLRNNLISSIQPLKMHATLKQVYVDDDVE